jgi:hypothetical protein
MVSVSSFLGLKEKDVEVPNANIGGLFLVCDEFGF